MLLVSYKEHDTFYSYIVCNTIKQTIFGKHGTAHSMAREQEIRYALKGQTG